MSGGERDAQSRAAGRHCRRADRHDTQAARLERALRGQRRAGTAEAQRLNGGIGVHERQLRGGASARKRAMWACRRARRQLSRCASARAARLAAATGCGSAVV